MGWVDPITRFRWMMKKMNIIIIIDDLYNHKGIESFILDIYVYCIMMVGLYANICNIVMLVCRLLQVVGHSQHIWGPSREPMTNSWSSWTLKVD